MRRREVNPTSGPAAHSPGPFKCRYSDQYSAKGSGYDVQAADGTVVASVIGTGPNCEWTETAKANFRLFVAAPELLAAVREFLTVTRDMPTVPNWLLAGAENAIRKATEE